MRVAIQRLYFLIWRVQLVISDFGSNGAHGDGDRSEEAMYLGVQHFFYGEPRRELRQFF
jgi:hypothetical protein